MIESHKENSLPKAAKLASFAVLSALLFMTMGAFMGMGPTPMSSFLQTADAQEEHGIGISVSCLKVEAGETNDCTFTVRSLDFNPGDIVTLTSVVTTLNGNPISATAVGADMKVIGTVGDTTDCTVGVDVADILGSCKLNEATAGVQIKDKSHIAQSDNNSYNAAATGTDSCGSGVPDCDNSVGAMQALSPAVFFGVAPDWEITKVADVDTAVPGDTINYTIELTNTGNTDISGVTVLDSLITLTREADDPGNDDDVLDSGETWVFSGSYEVDVDDCGKLPNIVTANGNTQLGELAEISDNETVDVLCPEWEITKVADAESVDAGDTINYTIELTNTGSVDITDVTVLDSLITLTREADDPGNDDDVLEPGETWVFSGSYITTTEDCDEVVNTVTANGNFQLGVLDEISDNETVEVVCEGNEGCTPGFWKANAERWNAVAWPDGVEPSHLISTVFSATDDATAYDGHGSDTLLEGLKLKGGPGTEGAAQILLRAGVAAYLNAVDDEVNYGFTAAEVQTMVNDALNSNNRGTMLSVAATLDEANNAGCFQNQQGERVEE
jgi:uncharacterized repeat protein (TIGR01451 family)